MIHYQQKIRQQIVLPAMQFINQEKSGGIVLGLAVVLALVLANSPLRFDYAHFLHHLFGFVVDGQPCLNFTLEHWINDGLMSMFFLNSATLLIVSGHCGQNRPECNFSCSNWLFAIS